MNKPGRSINVEWQETDEQLYELYQQQKDLKKRQRLQFLWLLRTEHTLKESAHIAGIGERSGQRYLRWYREGGVEELLKHQHGGDAPRQSFLTSEQQADLYELSK